MLFNSHVFLFLFLPITLLIYYQIGRSEQQRVAISWLVAASLFFYGWWNPQYLLLILFSILFNYSIGLSLVRGNRTGNAKTILILGIAGNLCLLGYFKYANFFVDNINAALGTNYHLSTIILPLAISFFTFQQITYLVDAWRGETREYDFLQYCLFVTFFPQLIAGPIVHHREMLPQFADKKTYRVNFENLAVGLTIFIIGLAKKVVIADTFALYATPVFDASAAGTPIPMVEAWGGAIAYSFQLYFDFSGYSDMAIGLARMFGIRLPLNFHSPYKAVNIIDFWRRWHMTLSRFLKDYIYIPLGGNRKGNARRYSNLFITMLLGGLWHGAGWTFVLWGALHGIYLVFNHAFRAVRKMLGQHTDNPSRAWQLVSVCLTFLAVTISWVLFRATDLQAAQNIYYGMVGLNGILLPESWKPLFENLPAVTFGVSDFEVTGKYETLLVALLLVWLFPNTQQLMVNYSPAFDTFRGAISRKSPLYFEWVLNKKYAALIAFIAAFTVLHLNRVSEFIYFQF